MSFHSKIGAGTLQYIAQALEVDITGIEPRNKLQNIVHGNCKFMRL